MDNALKERLERDELRALARKTGALVTSDLHGPHGTVMYLGKAEFTAAQFDEFCSAVLDRIAELEAGQVWIPVSESLPEIGQHVLLMADRYWNVPDGVEDARVTAPGYLSDFGRKYWSVFGERAIDLQGFQYWMPIPSPPEHQEAEDGR